MKDAVRIQCACVTVVLLVVSIAGGAILTDQGQDYDIVFGESVQLSPGPTLSTASAMSDGDDPYNCGVAQGWTSLYTTEAGSFD